MLNRFKNKLANIVNGISSYPKDSDSFSAHSATTDVSPFPYTRPSFLQLTPDEVQVSADHISRPILVPRSGNTLPWCTGYAEVINAGKTKVNEDQARVEFWLLQRRGSNTDNDGTSATSENQTDKPKIDGIPVHYFGLFDGHAGTGAGLMAVNILHLIIQDKLLEVQNLLEAQIYGGGLAFQCSTPQSPPPQSPTTPPFSPPPTSCNYSNSPLSDPSNPFVDVLTDPTEKTKPEENATSGGYEMEPIQESNIPNSDTSPQDMETSPSAVSETPPSAAAGEVKPSALQDKNGTSPILTDNNRPSPSPPSKSHSEDVPHQTPDSSVQPSLNQSQGGSTEAPVIQSQGGSNEGVSRSPSKATPTRARPGFSLSLDKFNVENLIVGALEASFFDMDAVICRERRVYRVPGGCTALAAVFFLNKLYVANAGDSRAIMCCNNEIIPISKDFTPETDRERIQLMAWHHPELLCNMFCPLQYAHRITRKDIGKRVLHRDGWRRGWAYRTVAEEDIKIPLIYGEGKKARLLGTIGVSRGFGDHDLKVYESEVYVKPFMTCAPEVRVYDFSDKVHTENDVLIMGSDGLWDVTTNEKAASIIQTCLAQFSPDDPNRYVSAAQELVMHARGILKGGWRTSEDRLASGDDITAFVIPLHHHGNACQESSTMETSTMIRH